VQELLADRFSTENIRQELLRILPGGQGREAMLSGYAEVHRLLGQQCAPDNAARIMTRVLRSKV
jgi:lipid-A-disaccharide synthase